MSKEGNQACLFLEALGEEIRNYELYRDLLASEEEAVLGEDPALLGEIIEAKQALIYRNNAIEERLAPMRRQMARLSLAKDDREKIECENERLKSLMKELVDKQARNEESLRTALGRMKSRLGKLSAGERAVTTYDSSFGGIKRIPKYIDKKK
jgi:hypothetical protein